MIDCLLLFLLIVSQHKISYFMSFSATRLAIRHFLPFVTVSFVSDPVIITSLDSYPLTTTYPTICDFLSHNVKTNRKPPTIEISGEKKFAQMAMN